MRTPRTLISLLLVALMLVSAVVPFASFADNENEIVGSTVGASKNLSDAELPSHKTLVGTKHLPPISNQGAIGSCASQSIAYEQMTNAVSRYVESLGINPDWNPSSGDPKYLISPKFTYDYSGSGTAWVYDILLDHGAATMSEVAFAQDSKGGYAIFKGGTHTVYTQYKETVAWYIKEGDLLNALKIRLKNWTSEEDQIWVRRDSFNDENGDVMITKTAEGKALLNKIKNYINNGNVVVTGGLSGAWRYDNRLSSGGNIGRKGEWCIAWAHSDQAGGHQVSIVGYDDEIECKINGATLKGGFLVANSWGDEWMNDGYVWLMYDALNSKSEFAEVNEKYPDRYIAMDQFCFTDWETDIEIGLPELMVQVEVDAVHREGVAIYLVRKEAKNEVYEKPKMFEYGLMNRNYHSNYDIEGAKYTFSGTAVKDTTKAETGYFTLAYGDLLDSIPEGKSFNDYEWGCRVYSVNGNPIKIKSIKLINSNETVLSEIEIPQGGIEMPEKKTSQTTGETYLFDFKNVDLSKSVEFEKDEKYSIEYTSSSKYIAKGSEVSFKVLDGESNASSVAVTVNGAAIEPVDGVYTFVLGDTNKISVTEIAEEQVLPTPEATTPEETTSKETDSTVFIIILSVIGVLVVGGVVVTVIVVSKKKKAE